MSHNMKFRNSILLLTLPLFSACSPTEMVTSIFDNHGGSWFGVVIGIVLLIIAIGLTIDSFSSGNVEDGFARFFGITLLIAGGIALVAAGPWGGSNDNPDNEETEATGHYSTSYDDDHGSSTKSSSSSSSSGTSSGGSVWDQPQPQYNNQQNYSGSSYENQSQEHHKSWHNEEYETSCDFCYGSGKCQTCNGDGWVVVMGIGENHYCVNCHNHDGRCTHCNGTGRVTKINRSYY